MVRVIIPGGVEENGQEMPEVAFLRITGIW